MEKNPLFTEHVKELGKLLAMLKVKLVYWGGHKGLMGTLADSVLAHEGRIMGIIPELLIEWEVQHKGTHRARRSSGYAYPQKNDL
ncbi:MAG: hypothetical protein WDM78_10305 [Puia sp.]